MNSKFIERLERDEQGYFTYKTKQTICASFSTFIAIGLFTVTFPGCLAALSYISYEMRACNAISLEILEDLNNAEPNHTYSHTIENRTFTKSLTYVYTPTKLDKYIDYYKGNTTKYKLADHFTFMEPTSGMAFLLSFCLAAVTVWFINVIRYCVNPQIISAGTLHLVQLILCVSSGGAYGILFMMIKYTLRTQFDNLLNNENTEISISDMSGYAAGIFVLFMTFSASSIYVNKPMHDHVLIKDPFLYIHF